MDFIIEYYRICSWYRYPRRLAFVGSVLEEVYYAYGHFCGSIVGVEVLVMLLNAFEWRIMLFQKFLKINFFGGPSRSRFSEEFLGGIQATLGVQKVCFLGFF